MGMEYTDEQRWVILVIARDAWLDHEYLKAIYFLDQALEENKEADLDPVEKSYRTIFIHECRGYCLGELARAKQELDNYRCAYCGFARASPPKQ